MSLTFDRALARAAYLSGDFQVECEIEKKKERSNNKGALSNSEITAFAAGGSGCTASIGRHAMGASGREWGVLVKGGGSKTKETIENKNGTGAILVSRP